MLKNRKFQFAPLPAKEFGGSLLVGKRKCKRDLPDKLPIHLVLKSENARGNAAFTKQQKQIESRARELAKIYGVRVYKMAVHWNHIHFAICFKNPESYKSWIRRLTSEIVKILGQKKNFLTLRPYTKILSWGKQYQNVLHYIFLNQLEVEGLYCRKIAKKYKHWPEGLWNFYPYANREYALARHRKK